MSNSLDSFLTRIGDVTIERVTPGTSPRSSDQGVDQGDLPPENVIDENLQSQTGNDDSCSDVSSGESADVERQKTKDAMQPDENEEGRSDGSGDDMDLDETIDTQIGVRMDSDRHQSESSSPEDDVEDVNILDTLPLEGAPIEGQEVTEADLLGQPLKDDDNESIDNDKSESMSGAEDDPDGHKRRVDPDNPESTKKKQKKDDGNEDSASECETKAEKKLANMRRNIREVMDETQLDEATLSAQRQEMERLRRVQEQQRIIREVQRQIAINRQNNKTQTRVISLLQGKQNQGDTTICESTTASSSSQVRLPSSVMLKVNTVSGASAGAATQMSPGAQATQLPRRPMENVRWQKSGRGGGCAASQQSSQTSISRVGNRQTGQNTLQQRIRMMTPSVSISPVVPKKETLDRTEYYSDSEISDIEEAEEALHEKQLHTMRKVSGAPKSMKPAKGKDVVTISSSSESSDDDCIVLSDPSGGEETDNEDDPSNSGMHTNDRYNLPDEHGRVLINVGHPDTEPDVYLAPQVARIIKPHQIGGIRFLFDNIVESIDRYNHSSGFGCILAHSMGLGKTLQVTSFCDIFFRCTTAKTVLCIMPINTLQNWLAEFNMWLPYEDPSTVGNNGKNVVKNETVTDSAKHEMKDDIGSQSDMSNMSRPISTESAHRIGHDQQPQHSQHSQHMINDPGNPYGHQTSYDNSMMPHYPQDGMMNKSAMDTMQMHGNYGGMTENSMYGGVTGYDPMKSDVHCQGIPGRPNYGMNSQFTGMDTRPGHHQGYPNMENPGNPGHMSYPLVNSNAPPTIYPNYDNSNPTQQYGNYPQPINHDVKKEEPPAQQPQNTDIKIKIEPETNDIAKKDENNSSTTKDENSDDKKPTEKVETPFNVDAPIGCELRPRHFRLHILNDSHKTMAARARVIVDWQKNGGVLLIGYELYRQLSLKKPNKAKRKRNQPFKDTVDVEEDDKNKGLLDEMHGALVSPGPDLVICDEGHRIKNSHASISMALKQMRTKRRIVLTGYPLQNNLLEYWCMVDFVRPNYLGTKSEFCNMFERPIQNGQCIDSTPQDIRLMRYRAHVLHALLEGFVQRRSHSVLQISLPRKEEYILLVRMTPHQRKLYDVFMNQVVKTRAVPNPLKAFAVCCKIWNHPDILYHFLRKRQANEEDDLDLEETIGEKPTPGNKRAAKAKQAKGETKKGKKLKETAKTKPAATVPPNSSSSSSNDNVDPENSNKSAQFSNYPTAQVNNTGYQNPGNQGNYPQGYQNYRPNEQTNYYRNDGNHGDYNEFYNNPNQQRYGNSSQSFQPYSQTNSGYNSSQNYNQNQQQQQSYIGNNDQTGNNPRFTSPSNNPDFRSEHNSNGNYDAPGMFPRPYGFQEQARNYSANLNQTTNNYSQNTSGQSSTFQTPLSQQTPNVPINDYSGYPNNQTQNYSSSAESNTQMYSRTDGHQPMQNPPLGYSNNQQNQNSGSQNQSANYNAATSANQGRGFSPGQPNSMHNSSHGYSSTQQQNSNIPNIQNPHGYQGTQQVPPQSAASHGYTANQQPPNAINSNQPQVYNNPNASGQPTMAHNSVRGYTGAQQSQNSPSQNQTSYPTSHTAGTLPQSQTHGYSGDRQGPTPPTQNPMHPYSGPNHHGQTALPHNQNPSYPANQQNQTPVNANYLSNQQQVTPQRQSHGYSTTQQSHGQSMGYPVNPSHGSGTNPAEQQLYTRGGEGQTGQNYSSGTGTSHDYSVERQGRNSTANPNSGYSGTHSGSQAPSSMTNYTEGGQNSGNQYNKGTEDPYWQQQQQQQQQQQHQQQQQQQPQQRNYNQAGRTDQCNNQYFREPTTNRYQNNYYPGQNYGTPTAYDGYTGTQTPEDTAKNSQSNITPRGQIQGAYDKSGKEKTSSVGVQSQTTLPTQNNAATATGYSNNETQCMPGPAQNVVATKDEDKDKDDVVEKEKDEKSDDEILAKDEEKDSKSSPGSKEEPGIPYDWATDLMKGYVPGLIDASAKMTLFFCILEESVRLGDRVLAFSQSLFTLNLIEDFLSRNNLKYPDGQIESWVKNINYYRLDGSTSALEREKLINEFNTNPKIHLFLVSTRAGSLGINLVGANRAIVFDASWNPCHDTQAVCRVYRYGQRKPCFVYRLVTDNCLERKIYDRQISKQGMADRVVDQCNPDAHLSLKEATTLSWDWEEDSQVQDFSQSKDTYSDEIMHCVLERHSSLLTKQPFHHESLLVDRKDKKLSQAEKRLARRGYELEKMAANCSRPSYSYVPGNTATRAGGLQIRAIRGADAGTTQKPVASVRPMQQRGTENLGNRGVVGSRWIPAEVWQRQGMSAQEMTLPLDVVIPTNSPDKGSIVLKAGQRVMVLKSPKGIYMQLESGKIIAIRTALKLNQQKKDEEPKKGIASVTSRSTKPEVSFPLRNNSAISIISKVPSVPSPGGTRPLSRPGSGPGYRPFADKEVAKRAKPVATGAAKPQVSQVSLTNQVSLQRVSKTKQDQLDHSSVGENSNSSDSQLRTDQRVEEVRLEDVVAEASSNPDYSPANSNRDSNNDGDNSMQKHNDDKTQLYGTDNPTIVQSTNVVQHHEITPEITSKLDVNDGSQSESKEIVKIDKTKNYDENFVMQTDKRQIDEITTDRGSPSKEPPTTTTTTTTTTAPIASTIQQTAPVQQSQLRQPQPVQPHAHRTPDMQKNPVETVHSTSLAPTCGTAPTSASSAKERDARVQELSQTDPHGLTAQGYPYAQYPRYYDYADPRARTLSNPYGTYFPGVTPHSTNSRLTGDASQKPQTEVVAKSTDDRTMNAPTGYSQASSSIAIAKNSETNEAKIAEPVATGLSASNSGRAAETHVPTAFSHPASSRYPGPYPPAPYDHYSQHYPPAPGSSAAYPPSGAPGYAAYGGPSYNADYARMYSAFHGPPPAADPYMHRGYAPPSTHSTNYYPPFPHPPPPPYPNYTFLPPYPNPNMPGEPQPPAQ